MKTTQRGFIIPLLLVIVAILLAGGGAYIYTNSEFTLEEKGTPELPQATSTASVANQTAPITQTSNTPTVGWKTYTNTKYGFSFRYPNDFEKSFEQDLNATNNIPFTTDFRPSGCFIVEGGSGLNDPKCRVYEVIVQGNKITEDGIGVSHTSTQMGGRTAEKLIWSEGGTSWTSIQVQYQGQWYIQQLTYPTGSNNEVLNTIIQSFKFIL